MSINPLMDGGSQDVVNPLMTAAPTPTPYTTPGIAAARRGAPTGSRTPGMIVSNVASLGANIATPAILSAVGLDAGLSTGVGLASALGLGASLGSVVPGIGTIIGAIVGMLASSAMRPNRPAIDDIRSALNSGRNVTPAQWNQAGYGTNGEYLSASDLLSRSPGQKNNAPLRDIADALYNGAGVSDASWAKAGLPPGGGAYGELLTSQIAGIKAQPGTPKTINSQGLATNIATPQNMAPFNALMATGVSPTATLSPQVLAQMLGRAPMPATAPMQTPSLAQANPSISPIG